MWTHKPAIKGGAAICARAATLFAVLPLLLAPLGTAQAENLAAIPPAAGDAVLSLPEVLSERDRDLYRRIFAEQEDGHWVTADRLIHRLENRMLMGHVLAQRYLHPTKYRSRYEELHFWLKKYADHPDAGPADRESLSRL